MKRKILSLILVFAMTVSLLTVGTGAVEPTYGDTAGHWAESSIERWSAYGIIQGSNGLFDPNGQLTCAQLATILAKLLKLPAAKDAGFTDNTADAWYYDAINRCAAAGILNGNGDGTVTPEAPITRERAMVMLARALGIEPIRKPDLTKYTDAAQVSAYAQGYLAAMIKAGIVGGVGDNRLAPQDNINRASTVTILDRAISTGASDVHIEPFEGSTRVRMRIDGTIVDYVTLQRSVHQPLIARIKIMANLDIAERRLPQDGHFRIRVGQSEYVNIRVSLLPTVFGEKAVLRILATAGQVDHASHFGMDDESYARFLPMLNSPNGIIYITGPTGSGKSTTLYMVLEYLSHRQVNISTVEDPVEKNVPSINQTQVNPVAGLTFESGLRALLRQDPDIIMVGETRDGETAGISVRAAITGHLVLSTLHTNDAVSSIVRLADMGIDHYLIANSLVGLVAQRLMRKVCPHCGREVAVTPQEQALLGKDITTIKRGTGCTHCNGTGYRGRIAVHEIVMIDRNIRRMISRGAETEEIEAYAREQQGMRSLKEKGLELVKQGVTTPEELLRIAYYA